MKWWLSVAASATLAGAVAWATTADAATRTRGSRGHGYSYSLSRRVGALIKQGKCEEAIDQALTAGDLDLAHKARAFCAGAADDGSAGPAPAAPFADPEGPDPPKSLSKADVDQWISSNVQAPGWDYVDNDMDGVHLATAAESQISPDKTLMVWAREELFRPVARSGLLARSDRQRFEIDCSSKRFRLLSMEVFSRNNLAGDSHLNPGPITDWALARPGSREAQQLDRICAVGAKGAGFPAR